MSYQTTLALLGYAIVITFMVLIMTKKMSAFTSLLIIPVVYGFIGGFGPKLGAFALTGIKGVVSTGVMLLFAILYFGTMLKAGLFDPLVNKAVRWCKGDPLKVIVATAVIVALISIDGDGATTYIIICAAMLPIYKKLGISPLILASITLMENAVMNILPWGGPTARVLSALNLESSQIMTPYYPAMAAAALYGVGVAYYIGKKERKRLGITKFDEKTLAEMAAATTAEEVEYKRPKLIWINLVMTLGVMYMLVAGIYPAAVIFGIATGLALMINYPQIKLQREIIEANAASALPVVGMVFAAGIFMGILSESKMAEAIAQNLVSMIPQSLGSHFGFITALISVPGAFFLSNDAFYFGVLPILAKAGAAYGFTAAQIGIASLIGQAFHLLSPLVASIYVLLQLTEVDMGEWQRYTAKWSIGVFVVYVAFMFFILRVVPL